MPMKTNFFIGNRRIDKGFGVYIVAEMSANHNQDVHEAVRIIHAANEAGADAVKPQTYTPDAITIDCDNDYFRIKGTILEGKNLAISGFPKPKFVTKL